MMFTKRSQMGIAAAGVFVLGLAVELSGPSLAGASAERLRAEGELTRYADPYGTGADNPVPAGSTARVQAVTTASGRTVVTLHVSGLPSNRDFGSHVHVLGCANNKAGGHYQNEVDPTPATPESEYANSDNEIWLDFTTDDDGNGSAQANVAWTLRPDGANAVVIHDRHTTIGDPGSGTAGPKLACLDVDF